MQLTKLLDNDILLSVSTYLFFYEIPSKLDRINSVENIKHEWAAFPFQLRYLDVQLGMY